MTNLMIMLSCACLVLVASAHRGHHRGCLFSFKRCHTECPEGTHVYSSACSPHVPTRSQRTCKSPVQRDMEPICDHFRCDCDEPTVKDEATGKCVKIEDCPQPDAVIDIRTSLT